MRFPEKLTVIVVDRDQRKPVQNVAIVLQLFAVRKNDYTIGPKISSENGRVEFTRDFCKASIMQDKMAFVMDYEDNLEDCRPWLDVRLHRPESIRTMLRNYAKNGTFWGCGFEDPESLFAGLESAANAGYEPASLTVSEEQLLGGAEIVLPLAKNASYFGQCR